MQQEENELLYLKHISNLHRLTVEQLHAIKEEKLNVINEITSQKQVILDSIVALQGKFEIVDCHLGIREKLKKLLQEIRSITDESQQILQERCTAVSKEMLANRKEMNINQAYESLYFQEQASFFNIKK